MLNGIVASGKEETELHAAVARAAPMATADWHVAATDRQYCDAVALVRSLSAGFGVLQSGLEISMADQRTYLQEGDHVALRIIAPDFPCSQPFKQPGSSQSVRRCPSHVRLDYLQSDGSVYHMQPSAASPTDLHEPLSPYPWPDPRIAEPPPVQSPFGMDIIIAIASETPLFATTRQVPYGRPEEVERTDKYLRALRSAVEAAQRRHEFLAGAAILLHTSPRPN